MNLELYADPTLAVWNDNIPGTRIEGCFRITNGATVQTFFGFYDASAQNWGTNNYYLGFTINRTGTDVIFQGTYRNNGAIVTTPTETVPLADFHKLTMLVNSTQTSASFYVDGSFIGSIVIGTLTNDVRPCYASNATGNKDLDTDYFYINSPMVNR